jgi:hypothetical protein
MQNERQKQGQALPLRTNPKKTGKKPFRLDTLFQERSHRPTRRNAVFAASVCRTVPERVCQAKTVFFGFFLGWCAPVAPWPLASFFVVCRKSGECNSCCFFCFFGVRLGCRRYGKLRSFFSLAIAPNTFLRKTPLTINREQLCRLIVAADADLSGANSSP